MGVNSLEGQATDEVLSHFDKNRTTAQARYLKFISDGISRGKRPELVGGGLKRSLAGFSAADGEQELFDERVLGSGSFVEQLRKEEELRDKLFANMKLPELMRRVEQHYGITSGRLKKQGRNKKIVTARDVFCHIAVRILLYPGTEAGILLNIGRSAASHAVRRGGEIVTGNEKIVNKLLR